MTMAPIVATAAKTALQAAAGSAAGKAVEGSPALRGLLVIGVGTWAALWLLRKL
jgi:hypothetical protein